MIGEITCDHMIVVLNKTDLLEPAKREAAVAKVTLPPSPASCVHLPSSSDEQEDATDSGGYQVCWSYCGICVCSTGGKR